MIAALFRRTVAANRVRLIACLIGHAVWGAVLPLVYASFGRPVGAFIRNSNNPLLEQFASFGGGDMFSLSGAMALGFIHPFAIAVTGIIVGRVPHPVDRRRAPAGHARGAAVAARLAASLYLVLVLVGALSSRRCCSPCSSCEHRGRLQVAGVAGSWCRPRAPGVGHGLRCSRPSCASRSPRRRRSTGPCPRSA